jgi:hypothetical protein
MKKNLTKGVITELLETDKKKSSFSVFRESLEKFVPSDYHDNSTVNMIRSDVILDYQKSCSEYEKLLSDPIYKIIINYLIVS